MIVNATQNRSGTPAMASLSRQKWLERLAIAGVCRFFVNFLPRQPVAKMVAPKRVPA
jgi:hypothetical protein